MGAIALAILAAIICWALTALYIRAMHAAGSLEPPSERGMHTLPVPSGAGIAIVATVLAMWPLSQPPGFQGVHLVLLAATLALGGLSWIDDRRRLSPGLRLVAQAVAVGLLLYSLGPDQRIATSLPLLLERAAIGFAWLWFINLFNFMDGIDGLAGCEAIAIAAGYIAVVAAAGVHAPLSNLALILAAACCGYLVWNWHPARVFMGDAGSVTLGFLLGWLLIDLALRGQWQAGLILPLYFAADATFTLLKRLVSGKRAWQPHREHFYQRAVLGGATPNAVVWRVNAANAVLIALAMLSTRYPMSALALAAFVVIALLLELERLAA